MRCRTSAAARPRWLGTVLPSSSRPRAGRQGRSLDDRLLRELRVDFRFRRETLNEERSTALVVRRLVPVVADTLHPVAHDGERRADGHTPQLLLHDVAN